jgi:tRNA pseudouridine38-40 synthase
MADALPSAPGPVPAPAVPVATDAPTTAAGEDDQPKLKKCKYAIQFGYCGAKYHGLQTNALPTHMTIEDVLIQALHKAGLITDCNMDNPFNKIGWQRASRTDKGVSALRNLASAKLLKQPDGDEAAVQRINSFLPADIRVYGLQPVTSSFNSYLNCTGREYEYYLPTFALLTKSEFQELIPRSVGPLEPTRDEMNEAPLPKPFTSDTTAAVDDAGGNDADDDLGEAGGGKRGRGPRDDNDASAGQKAAKTEGDGAAAADASASPAAAVDGSAASEKFFMFQSCPPDVMARLRAHRVGAEVVEKARALFRFYEGTQSFHNFTPRGHPSNPKMMRYMRKIRMSDPFVVRASMQTGELLEDSEASSESTVELEFVRIELDGQSFMLNQIRKMIGTVSMVLSGGLDGGWLRQCLEKSTIRGMPMAPANGLFLVNLFFERYNFGLVRIQSEGCNAADRKEIVMANMPADRVDHVRRRVLASIVRQELAHDIFGRWMRGTRFIANLAWKLEFE